MSKRRKRQRRAKGTLLPRRNKRTQDNQHVIDWAKAQDTKRVETIGHFQFHQGAHFMGFYNGYMTDISWLAMKLGLHVCTKQCDPERVKVLL